MSLILLRFARPQCLAATHLSSPEVGNGLSWPKPQCICNAMVTSQAQHSTYEGVLRSCVDILVLFFSNDQFNHPEINSLVVGVEVSRYQFWHYIMAWFKTIGKMNGSIGNGSSSAYD